MNRDWCRIGMASAGLLAVAVLGCEGPQSILDPRGPQAARIASLWWVMLAGGTVIALVVTALIAAAVRRGARGPLPERRAVEFVVIGAIAVPSVLLLGLLVASVAVSREMVAEPPADALTVEVIGHQWWWEIHVLDAGGQRIATTANELHIPVGEPVRLVLRAADVIHSFWVPNLHGKTDLIPGRTNHTWLQADEAGTYRGQCAEFCGLQHAHMAFLVIAEPPEQFRHWLERQQQPAAEPTDPTRRLGRDVFLSSSCVLCHSVRGTMALATTAPDLTHLASRRTLAAGTLPNTRGHLAAWILDPQGQKPGSHMPATPLDAGSLHALLDYLEGLQ